MNYYTHGTQVTAAHGHLAFFGAYVMLNLAVMPMPCRNCASVRLQSVALDGELLDHCTAMMTMTFALTFAGVVQVHLQRVLGQSYMDVQDQLAMFYWCGSAPCVRGDRGVMFVWAVLVPGRAKEPVIPGALQPAE